MEPTRFLAIIANLQNIGVHGAREQFMLALLWERGPMTGAELSKELRVHWGSTVPTDRLQRKGLVQRYRVISEYVHPTKWCLTTRSALAFNGEFDM